MNQMAKQCCWVAIQVTFTLTCFVHTFIQATSDSASPPSPLSFLFKFLLFFSKSETSKH